MENLTNVLFTYSVVVHNSFYAEQGIWLGRIGKLWFPQWGRIEISDCGWILHRNGFTCVKKNMIRFSIPPCL